MHPQVFDKPLRTVWNVANQPTESLWWPAATQQDQQGTKTIIFFICGNPGLVDYYSDFLNTIYEQSSNPLLEIVADQIDHKIACFDLLYKENGPDANYILMGHSMGCYVGAEVLKQRQHHNIKRLIALFPTLREIALTPNGVALSKSLFKIPLPIISGAVGLTRMIPGPIRELLTGLFTGQKDDIVKVTAHGLLHPSVIENVIHLAREEMEMIKALDDDFYAVHVDKFIMYYSRNDKWAPLDHHDYMADNFPNGNKLDGETILG
ncbi:hypothetical protein BC941DRAFT_343483 [Chlamydoabsidia padenii]|nr:hypothetical protein BC941DRAFT_343483 [Chlamydoabsidia padenii]